MNGSDANFGQIDQTDLAAAGKGGDQYQKLLDFLPVPVYTCDAEGRLTYYNKAAENCWGIRPVYGDASWLREWKAYTCDGHPIAYDDLPVVRALRTGFAANEEIIIENPAGHRRYIQVLPKPFFDTLGKVAGVVNTHIDISEKNNLRAQLANVNEAGMRSRVSPEDVYKMIDEVQDYAIIMLDSNGNILNWNKGAERIKGYRTEEIVGQSFKKFYLPEDNERQLPARLLEEAVAKGRAVHEGWRIRKNGTMFWGSVVITAIHDDEGDVIGFTKVTRDLTDRKASEDRIRNYSAELEFKNKELEQFAYIASHDLQEPLRKIMVFSAIMRDHIANPEKVLQYAQKITSSADRMSSLVQEVLKYARLTDEAEATTVDLNYTLKGALEDYEIVIREKQAVVEAEHLPLVKGYDVQLRQLFSNLIGNALKFAVEGRIPVITVKSSPATHVEILRIPTLRATINYNKFIFSDNGQGFSDEFCSKIFKMFQREDTSREGSGIGLALCQKIINNHQGYIKAESVLNEGTSIIFYLPVIY